MALKFRIKSKLPELGSISRLSAGLGLFGKFDRTDLIKFMTVSCSSAILSLRPLPNDWHANAQPQDKQL
jgi:hypothetical protein